MKWKDGNGDYSDDLSGYDEEFDNEDEDGV